MNEVRKMLMEDRNFEEKSESPGGIASDQKNLNRGNVMSNFSPMGSSMDPEGVVTKPKDTHLEQPPEENGGMKPEANLPKSTKKADEPWRPEPTKPESQK